MFNSASCYGDTNAAFYDQIYPRIDPRILDRLQALARGRAVLELGVGTGRCARPLAARGLRVVGVDASALMMGRCRQRDTSRALQLVRADIAKLPFRGGFGLVYSLVSTLSLLPDRAAQCTALRGIAAALEVGGYFVEEGSLTGGNGAVDFAQTMEVPWIGSATGVYRYRTLPISSAMLDQFAEHAGLKPIARWGDWSGRPLRSTDLQAISVYQRNPS